MTFYFRIIFTISLVYISACTGDKRTEGSLYTTWQQVNGNAEGNKYSSLRQIDTGNVMHLLPVWKFHTGDADTAAHSQIQCDPIIINGILYATSPQLKLFAIDAATGKQKWMFSPFDTIGGNKTSHFIINNNRGVTYWTDGANDSRIFYAAASKLYCINAETGKPVTAFGNNGTVDLHIGLQMEDINDLFVTSTSAPSVYKDLLLFGTRVSEGMDAAPGDIRALDVRTGNSVWSLHTIPRPGEAGYETWENPAAWKMTGGANNWMGITIDKERGIAYIPTGSAAMDFYGGRRKALISMPTAFWLLMRLQVSGYGIFNWCIMIHGITILPVRRYY